MRKIIIWFVVSVVVLGIGIWQNTRYEGSPYVKATITRFETDYDSDSGYVYKYYGDYYLDGVKYSNIKLHSEYTDDTQPDMAVGDTYSLHVNPENSGKALSDGGLFIVAGFVMLGFNIYLFVKTIKSVFADKKKQRNA
jgi:hypothetical protein